MSEPKIPPYVMIGDSSTVVVRSVRSVLENREFDPFLSSRAQRIGASVANNLPASWRRYLMEHLSGTLGYQISKANEVRSSEMVSWITTQYAEKKYDAIVVGAPSGGAAHLCSLLGAPYLTQHFLIAFKGKFPIDDSKSYLDNCLNPTRTIIDNNPDLHAIIHYDPIHDRFLVGHSGFVRFKLLRIPDGYKEFIATHIKPDGAIILLGCDYPWKQYEISDKINYQLGGLGGVVPDEYYNGSERIEDYIASERGIKSKEQAKKLFSGWLLDGYPLVETPESEWGLVRSFADDLREFARSKGIRIIEINLRHPEQLSALMFKAFNDLIASEYPSAKPLIFMDSFTHSSPSFNRKVSACPLWLPFICDDSFEFAKEVLDKQASESEILLALHPSFSRPFDLTPLQKWENYLSRFAKVTLMGVNRRAYPENLTSYFTFTEDTKRYATENPRPLRGFCSVEYVKELAKESDILRE